MCGIAGILSLEIDQRGLSSRAKSMADAIAHRGPDAEGVWASNYYPVALAHRRLSILDLSSFGSQPMLSQAKNGVISFNGEIYNFASIKNKIKNTGYSFKGNSDTEVLLQSIECFGVDQTLQSIKGMFAFAYWDEISGKLTLVRDRIGEKPLYYGIIDNTFIFSSELKSIFQIFSPKSLTLDQNAVSGFLRYGYISAPLSIFKEIKKLPPGTKAVLDVEKWMCSKDTPDNHLHIKPYWSVQDIASKVNINQSNDSKLLLADLDHLINTVIEEQAISDVPLGSFLSGGIDSSLVTAILQSQSKKPIETFTIGFHEKEFNEAEHAGRIACHLGTAHNELYLNSSDILDVIPSLPHIYDEPFADASQIPTFLVSKFARTKLTVCLSGDGGDELFAGYNRYIEGQRFQKINHSTPRLLRKALANILLTLHPSTYNSIYKTINTILRRKGGANFGSKIHKAAYALNLEDAYRLYQFLCSYNQQPSTLLLNGNIENTLPEVLPFNGSYMSAAMAWDQKWYLPGDNLVKSDRASMFASLETRVPLLDKDVIEFSWNVPNSLKWKDGQSKWLLRQLLYRYVPQKMIDRPKMGFSMPINHWLKHELRDWAEDQLSPTSIANSGVFDIKNVSALWEDHLSGKSDNANALWALLMFQSWHNEYC